ncbi:MAG: hypothetical protein J6B74_08885 [Ruminococcus sp.]|nr:hypothetical protein [Ruminococcus sp.]
MMSVSSDTTKDFSLFKRENAVSEFYGQSSETAYSDIPTLAVSPCST